MYRLYASTILFYITEQLLRILVSTEVPENNSLQIQRVTVHTKTALHYFIASSNCSHFSPLT